nr:MAG: hypothetical protein 3 [Leviviridae sp.]
MSLWSCAADELAARCCTSATRDCKTVASRFEHEGLQFLAVTLADFGKAVERWLDQGFVVPSDVTGWGFPRTGRLTGLPRFLSGFLGRVFEPSSGVLLEHPDIEAIYAVRQLTLMFGKIALPVDPRTNGGRRQVVTPEREKRAMQEYIQCEYDVKACDERLDPDYLRDFQRISQMLFGEVFAKVDRDIHWNRMVPKHGPGATADKLVGNGKWNQRTWPARLGKYFPPEEYLVPNPRFHAGLGPELNVVEPEAETPVRVITVPKTLKTPRIIAIEPTAMQYAQQAILRSVLDAWSEDGFLSQVIGFDDQDPNRALACEGSLGGELATLDLSEASDRVSNRHVRAMLSGYPQLLGAVQACRSRKADVPGHGVIRLSKFASMGSALCFPFEAMAFLTLIVRGFEQELGTPLSRKDVVSLLSGKVRVFGDDIIVPVGVVHSVIFELEAFGYRVNEGKSFWTGRFRESCGREYFDGVDVSIVRVRQVLPTSRRHASEVIAAVEFRNLAYWSGLWKTAAWMDDFLRRLIPMPNVAPSSSLLGRQSVLGYEYQGLDRDTHSPLTKGYYVVARPPEDNLEGVGALTKCLFQPAHASRVFGMGLSAPDRAVSAFDALIELVRNASVDSEHLERSGRPERVSIKLGRRSPF